MQGFNPALGDAEEVMKEHSRLVTHLIGAHFSNTEVEFDELFSAGLKGLWKAYKSFSPEKAKWSTYAGVCIQNEIRMYMRSVKKAKKFKTLSLDKPVNDDGNHETTLSDLIADVPEDLSAVQVSEFISSLPETERKIALLYMNGCNQKEIAEAIGLSRTWVSRLVKRIAADYQKGKYRSEKGATNCAN